MVLTHAVHETVFSVLAEAAGRRTSRSLAAQSAVATLAAVVVVILAPQWWSLALLLGAPAAYGAWGLVSRAPDRPATQMLAVVVAATGTLCAIVGTVGLAFALFTGTAKGTYSPCGKDATSRMCRAWADPATRTGPIP